jgi:hypothetical protein
MRTLESCCSLVMMLILTVFNNNNNSIGNEELIQTSYFKKSLVPKIRENIK